MAQCWRKNAYIISVARITSVARPNSRLTRLLLTSALLIAGALPLTAQERTPKDTATQKPAAQNASAAVDKVVRLTPSDTLAAVTLRPQRIAAGKNMELAPLEVITAAGLEHVGVDPLKIERADLLLGFPGPAGPQGGLIVQLTEPFSISQLNPQLLDGQGVQHDKDFEFFGSPENELIYHQFDPQTVLAGTRIFVKQMVAKRSEPGKVASLLQQIKTEHDLSAIVTVDTLRPLIVGMLDQTMQGAPPAISEDTLSIVQSTDFVALGINVADEQHLQLVIAGATDDDAKKLEQSFSRLIKVAETIFVSELKNQLNDPSQTTAAIHSYLDRVSGQMAGKWMPVRKGRALVLDVQEQMQSVAVIGTLTGLLLPAVQAAREAARRVQGSNNLKQIGLALHNFASAYQTFPATAGLDDDGQPMLSWRVAILPFIEQNELYNQFHMDEPWDSEHNIQLLELMPDTYRDPKQPTQPGYTVYQATVSEQSLLRKTEPSGFQDITDGTSNTIMAVETNAAIAVPWTAPQDYEIDEDNPGKNLFTNGIVQALFGDGSVQTLSEVIDPNILNALFTRDGGEVVELP